MTEAEMLEAEKNWCENCCNFDKEHSLPDGYANCKVTNTLTFGQTCGKECKFFNVPAGNVIVIPCMVGADTVYVDCKAWRKAYSFVNYPHVFIKEKYYIVADVVAIIKTRKQTLVKLGTYNKATFTREYERFPISAIGKTVFLSEAEARKALQGNS